MADSDYTSRDYAAIKADLIARIPDILPEWTNIAEGDFGIAMLEQFAYVGDLLNFYIDRVANESFPQSAVLRSSIIAIAGARGYLPVQQSAATTTLSFTLAAAASGVTIPKGTPVLTVSTGSAPVRFETVADLVIATMGGTATVTAAEGTTVSNESVALSDGSVFQFSPLYNPHVISGSVLLEVADGVGGAFTTWTLVDNLVDAGPTSPSYVLRTDDGGVTYVSFGDGFTGKVPAIGAAIRATYRYGVGAAGNVGNNVLTVIGTALPLVASVTNTSPATGGADVESIDSIRTSIGKSQRSRSRAVSLDDYASLSLNVPGVAKASAFAGVWTTVSLYIAPSGGGAPGSPLITAVNNYLVGKVLLGSSTSVLAPTYVGINLAFDLHVNAAYTSALVVSAVNQAIANYLAFDAVNFGQRVTVGQIYKVLHSVDGVDYATLTLMVRATAVTQAGVQDIVCALNEIPQAGTVTPNATGGI